MAVLLATTATAWTAVEHDSAMAPLANPQYEGRDNVGSPSIPLPNMYNSTLAAGAWTAFAACDDCEYPVSPPGWNFPFYATTSGTVRVSTNGFLGVGGTTGSGCCSGAPIPTTAAPNSMVAGFWEDLNPATSPPGAAVQWKVTNPYSNTSREVFVANWHQICHYSGQCSTLVPGLPGPIVNMMIFLFEDTGTIETHYMIANPDTGQHTLGMESASGTTGIQYRLGTPTMTYERVQYRRHMQGPIATPDGYTIAFSPGAILIVDGSAGRPAVIANDIQMGHLPFQMVPGSATTPLLPTSVPWGTLLAFNNDGTFRFQLGNTCPLSGVFDVKFQYRLQDAWRQGLAGNVTVRVTGCQAPPIAGDDILSVNEGPGPFQLDVLANDVDPGDTFVIDQVTFGGPGSLVIAGAGSRLDYTPPHQDFNSAIHGGPLAASYRIRDSGGDTDTATVTLTIAAVNDAPVATPGAATVAVLEGAGSVSIPWATALAAGAPQATDESSQTLSFIVTDSDPALFASGGRPAMSSSGQLTFTLANGDVNTAGGPVTVTATLIDSGPGAAPHVNAAAPMVFQIVVTPVNDPPSFAPGPAVVNLPEGPGLRTVAWATGVQPGPATAADESTQSVEFLVSFDNPGLFAGTGPQINSLGQLVFTIVDGDANKVTHGESVVTVTVRDNGPGTAPNSNTGNTAQVRIVVDPVNDPPTVTPGPNVAVLEGAPLDHTFPNWLAGTHPGGGADEAAQTVAVALATTILSGPPDLFSAGPTLTGTTLSFSVRDTEASGVARITLTPTDSGGGILPDQNVGLPAVATITVTNVNDAPVAVDDALADVLPSRSNQAVLVLGNDHDVDNPNGDLRVLETDVMGLPGTLSLDADGRTLRFNPTLDVRGPATFRYRATDGAAGSNWATVAFEIRAPTTPVAAIDVVGRPCAGTPVVLVGYGVLRGHTTASWAWNIGGVAQTHTGGSDVDSATATFATAGARMAALTVTFSDGLGGTATGSASAPINVEGCRAPTPAFQAVRNGPDVHFVDQSVDHDGTIVAWAWDFGDGQSSSTRSPGHTYGVPGTYVVRLTVRDNEGNSATVAQLVTTDRTLGGGAAAVGGPGAAPAQVPSPPPAMPASDPPAASPTNRPPVARAQGPSDPRPQEMVSLSAAGTHDPDGDPLRFAWTQVSGPDTVVLGMDDGDAAFRPPSGGRYVLHLLVDDGRATDTATVVVDVAPASHEEVAAAFVPVVDAVQPARVVFADRSVASREASFAWDFGDGGTSTDRFPSHTYQEEGDYVVRLVVTDAGQRSEALQSVRIADPAPAARRGLEHDLGAASTEPSGADDMALPALVAVAAAALVTALATLAMSRWLRR